MRLTQVSRQSFVGIDLLRQEVAPLPFPLALHIWALFDSVHDIELLQFRSFGADSQIAIALAVRDLVFGCVFNEFVHFCLYIKDSSHELL